MYFFQPRNHDLNASYFNDKESLLAHIKGERGTIWQGKEITEEEFWKADQGDRRTWTKTFCGAEYPAFATPPRVVIKDYYTREAILFGSTRVDRFAHFSVVTYGELVGRGPFEATALLCFSKGAVFPVRIEDKIIYRRGEWEGWDDPQLRIDENDRLINLKGEIIQAHPEPIHQELLEFSLLTLQGSKVIDEIGQLDMEQETREETAKAIMRGDEVYVLCCADGDPSLPAVRFLFASSSEQAEEQVNEIIGDECWGEGVELTDVTSVLLGALYDSLA